MSALAGKTALVTGAAKRIGRQIALRLAGEGVHCLIHYNRSAIHAKVVVEECRALGVRAEAVAANLEDLASIHALATKAVEFGVDILVHNASTFDRLPFFESALAAHAGMLARDFAVHVSAPYLLSRIIGERMVEKGWGRIVLFGDWSSEAAVYRHYGPYIVSKAAVPTLTKVLALELGSRSPGVTVNAVLPGPAIPPEGQDPADVAMVERQTVLGSWVGTEEITRAVLFFAASDKITGSALRVDGGRAIKAL
ncbi:MAG TPA: SDR family oxidoreductase [Candidatus Binatia bacterium]|nr:SDR family oxidoreductase [Candidatus Binatia bacterium]